MKLFFPSSKITHSCSMAPTHNHNNIFQIFQFAFLHQAIQKPSVVTITMVTTIVVVVVTIVTTITIVIVHDG